MTCASIIRSSPRNCSRSSSTSPWRSALTQIPAQGVADEIYERVRTQLSEKEISDLTFSVMAINAWNRVNVAFHIEPGIFDKAYGLEKANLS
jgi:hypothetical protein